MRESLHDSRGAWNLSHRKTPFYGWPRMTAQLRRDGYEVNPKRVRRLLQVMGLQAIYPKPRLSQRGTEVTIYPYLLSDLQIVRPNQVWSADITYLRMTGGFMYLVAILDWFSRYVLAWQVSNTLESSFCVQTLEQALRRGSPEIFNTDQGVQFTARAFVSTLLDLRGSGSAHQYGRTGAGVRQHLCGAVMAHGQV